MNENTEEPMQQTIAEIGGEVPERTTSAIPRFQCPKCERIFTSAPALRMHHVRKHSGKGWSTAGNFKKKKKSGGNTGMKLAQWTPARRAQFKRTWAKKKSETAAASGNASGNNTTPGTREINPGVMFCPRCGTNIKVVAAALAFGDRP